MVAATGTTTMPKTARHDQVEVSQAAMGAPTSDGRTHAADSMLNTRGRVASG